MKSSVPHFDKKDEEAETENNKDNSKIFVYKFI